MEVNHGLRTAFFVHKDLMSAGSV